MTREGSGQFLVGAARRIAYKLAAVRSGDDDPTPEYYRPALREVISRCIYGVDINEMAVELCKINLWLESVEPGKPLSFLDHHIQCGNSLLGTTPALIAKGIPEDAFEMIEGDKRADVTALKRQNQQESTDQGSLFFEQSELDTDSLNSIFKRIDEVKEEKLQDQIDKEDRYQEYLLSEEYSRQRLLADAWAASFVWIKNLEKFELPLTQAVFDMLKTNPAKVDKDIIEEIGRLASQYQFFHWHLAFPDIFSKSQFENDKINEQAGWDGGFDIVIGNPPWERIKLQEKEWFASRVPEISSAPNAASRHRLIEELKKENPEILNAFRNDRRQAEGESHLVRHSGLFPLCGRGDINTYSIFTELMKNIISPVGRVGCVVPTGIATDDTTKYFFQDIMESKALISLYDFENRKKIFSDVEPRQKFCLLTLTGAKRPAQSGTEFCFFAYQVEDLLDVDKVFTLSAEDLELLNPNTKTCPIFRSRRDAELAKSIYRRVPVLVNEGAVDGNPWGISFLRMFDMSNDSHLFRDKQSLHDEGCFLEGNIFIFDKDYHEKRQEGEVNKPKVFLPLYEAKMIHHYDHRFGSYRDVASGSSSTQLPTPTLAEYGRPDYIPLPRYWVDERQVIAKITDVPRDLARAWLEYDEGRIAQNFSLWLNGWRLINKKGIQLSQSLKYLLEGNLNEADSAKAQRFAGEFFLDEKEIAEIREYDDLFAAVDNLIRKRNSKWLMGFRGIARNNDERTTIAAVIKSCGVGNSMPIMFFNKATAIQKGVLCANLSSFALDFIARFKVGGTNFNFFIFNQLPICSIDIYNKLCPWALDQQTSSWLLPRVIELLYTAWDLTSFAKDCGFDGHPFRWDEERRFIIRCEIDAAFFHLYGIARDDVDYIMETFPIVKRNDEAAYGEYRTKETILEIYDQMKVAIESGRAYQTQLNPPPGLPEKYLASEGQALPVHIHRE